MNQQSFARSTVPDVQPALLLELAPISACNSITGRLTFLAICSVLAHPGPTAPSFCGPERLTKSSSYRGLVAANSHQPENNRATVVVTALTGE